MSGEASVQTSYGLYPALGFPGQVYDSDTPKVVISRIASEVIAYGKYVYYTDENCHIGTTQANISSNRGGVALRDPANPNGAYQIGDAVAILVDGFVWVPTEEAVVVTDAVFVRVAGASGASQANGWFRNDAGGTGAGNPAGAAWHKGGTSLAVLRLGTAGLAGGATTPTS